MPSSDIAPRQKSSRPWLLRCAVASLAALATLAATGLTAVGDKRVIAPPGPKPVGPYSPGILVGDYLYVSGQGGRDQHGTLPPSVEGQARQTLANIKSIVDAAGMTMAHVVYCQVYVTDIGSLDVVDRVWREFFPKAPPARAVLGVHRLPTDIAVEINAVAFANLARRKIVSPRGQPPGQSWSAGVMAGDRLFVSGSFGTEVAAALEGVKSTLAAAGLDFRHLVFVNPYLTNDAPPDMDQIYATHFEAGNAPARATIRVASLPGPNTIAFTGVAIADLSKRRAFRPKNMRPSPTASPCVLADDTYYCSAKSAFIPGPAKVQGIFAPTIELQVRQTLRNLLDGLEEGGLDFSHVVATNVYLDDMNDFSRMNGIYAQYFSAAPPTRTTIAQVAPTDRAPRADGTYPALEQISLIAVK